MMARLLSYAGLASAFALVISVLVGGCAAPISGGRGGAWCEIERPIRLSEATISTMTKAELEVAVSHNEHGQRECGWTPKRTTK